MPQSLRSGSGFAFFFAGASSLSSAFLLGGRVAAIPPVPSSGPEAPTVTAGAEVATNEGLSVFVFFVGPPMLSSAFLFLAGETCLVASSGFLSPTAAEAQVEDAAGGVVFRYSTPARLSFVLASAGFACASDRVVFGGCCDGAFTDRGGSWTLGANAFGFGSWATARLAGFEVPSTESVLVGLS